MKKMLVLLVALLMVGCEAKGKPIRAITPAIVAPNSPNEASITLLLNGVVYHILVFPVNLL